MLLRRALLTAVALVALAAPASAMATSSDLAVSTNKPGPVQEEGGFNYVVTVNNHGPDDAQNVTLSWSIPTADAVFTGGATTQGGGSIDSSGNVLISFGTIANGGQASATLTYTAPKRETFTVSPSTTFNPVASQSDPDTSNNSTTDSITVVGLSATQPDFADQPVGTVGAPQPVTLTNNSAQSVTLGTLPFAGANPFDFFDLGDTCAGATLASGASCTLALRFAPSDLGTRSASMTFAPTGGSAVDPLELDFSGNGIPLPVDTGPVGPTGATGPQGPAGSVGPPAFKLALASAVKKIVARRGKPVTLGYASTLKGSVRLDVLKRAKRIARVNGSARQGPNRIRWNGKAGRKAAKAGRYVLRLTAVSGGQTTTLKVPLTLR